jgi:predicted enzyme related to lactoylglutathione lyase/uncharacterized protein YndB with AHSA1/START domain
VSDAVSLQRDYPVPPERLYEAWTNVDLLRRWFGCGPDMLWTVHEWDVRPGGAIHVSLEFDAGPFHVTGEFLVVDPPRRLRYRWSGAQIVDVTIEPSAGGSRLRLTHTGLTHEECDIVDRGWTTSLQQLGQTAGIRRRSDVPGRLIHWFDIPVLDIERAGGFYSTILDMELRHLEAPPDFVMKWFPSDESGGGGGLIQGGDRRPSSDGTVVYFNAGPDLDRVLSRIEPAGGKVLMEKTGSPESGYVAFFLDTEGNRVGLQSPG